MYPKLRTIYSPDTTASSGTQGRRVFEIKLIYIRIFPLTANEFLEFNNTRKISPVPHE
jgi:hypothetical protein